jgi:hypothetical protein
MKFRTAATLKNMATPHVRAEAESSLGKRISVVWQKRQSWVVKPRVLSMTASFCGEKEKLCPLIPEHHLTPALSPTSCRRGRKIARRGPVCRFFSRLAVFVGLASAIHSLAADVTVSDSVVSLAINGTTNYTFTDPGSGQDVVVAVTMSPYSTDPAAVFSILDGNTRVGVGNPNIGGDGNLISYGEGVNFTASLVSSSAGVEANSVRFRVAGLGLRATDGTPLQYWVSSATTSNSFNITGEMVDTLDSTTASLYGNSYLGQLRFVQDVGDDYQLSDNGSVGGLGVVLNATFTVTNTYDPRTNSWFTAYSGKYARIYTNNAMKTAGTTLTTWSNGSETQSAPAYCGVQEVDASTNWVYVHSTGLAGYNMGPWQNGSFPNLPVNQHLLYRFPRTNNVPAAKSLTGAGEIGIFVDGVEMFNSWDANYWNGTADVSFSGTNGFWNRDAYVNEGATFDPGNAHQQQQGTYHYHANPIALRYQLGDHVNYDSSTKTYSEDTNAPTKHSPILGWVGDSYPIYGPYGYSNPTNASSGIRRMISGYVIRNGQYGTSNLTANGRTTIPQWAVRAYNTNANQTGPAVSSSYPLGRYMEDNDYLGDHGYVQGVDFDLDEYNGRWCVTPEFPTGTYAYFVSIASDGTPTFPYNIGRAFYGSAAGGSVSAINETVVTNFVVGPNGPFSVSQPVRQNPTVTLAWSSVDGGTYRVECSTNLTAWTTNLSSVASQGISTQTNLNNGATAAFYRVALASVSNYDSVTGPAIITITPNSGTLGQNNISITAVINSSNPAPPPHTGAPIQSFTIGSAIVTGTSYTYNSTTGAGTVTGTLSIPGGASKGSQTATITFNPPMGQSNGVSFTQSAAFTFN